jgi:hypothetical protein
VMSSTQLPMVVSKAVTRLTACDIIRISRAHLPTLADSTNL